MVFPLARFFYISLMERTARDIYIYIYFIYLFFPRRVAELLCIHTRNGRGYCFKSVTRVYVVRVRECAYVLFDSGCVLAFVCDHFFARLF